MRQFDLDVIQHITFFENKTQAEVRDCILNGDCVYFLVEKGNMKKALGKSGFNIKSLQAQLNKRVKIWEFDENPEQFIKNLVPQAEDLKVSGNSATIRIPVSEKGKVIGKEGSNIKNLKEILKRNSDIENLEIK